MRGVRTVDRRSREPQPAGRAVVVAACAVVALAGGCEFRRDNIAESLPAARRPRDPSLTWVMLRNQYIHPIRDYLILDGAGRALFGDEAWNIGPNDEIGPSPFMAVPSPEPRSESAPQSGPAGAPPEPPWTFLKAKTRGATPGFVGRDGRGRTYFVKLDEPDYPELGSGAEVIASRLYRAVGYNAPIAHAITIEGTGDPSIDGRRAVAVEKIDGRPIGPFFLDHFRMRRELRGLRVLCAWLNDVDRVDKNTLETDRDGRAIFYFLDFNSSLGSWNGRPKPPWRGWRTAWDQEWLLLTALTLGLLPPPYDPQQPVVSPALGRFNEDVDLGRWRSQFASTPFDRMTRRDALWMLRRIEAISESELRAIIASARYSRTDDAEALFRILVERRRRLGEQARAMR